MQCLNSWYSLSAWGGFWSEAKLSCLFSSTSSMVLPRHVKDSTPTSFLVMHPENSQFCFLNQNFFCYSGQAVITTTPFPHLPLPDYHLFRDNLHHHSSSQLLTQTLMTPLESAASRMVWQAESPRESDFECSAAWDEGWVDSVDIILPLVAFTADCTIGILSGWFQWRNE